MAKYTRKPSDIEAIQFIYSKNGVIDLEAFCGDKLVSVSKERHMDSIAKATIKTSMVLGGVFIEEVIYEGDYILAGSLGNLFVLPKCVFERDYEAI